ncbi:VLRF1 family aeRF1-type release factor [Paenibacillus massiliensis]|uniref:VLRF1 family aeRF1-type release factor n=1 Tax=Paenibacillus massiliensis TaxID=225917 RepID=UPI000470AAF0|nr:VLRF1 family aeRF1-type release factor [Paenibacillus massiliensis]
MKWIDKWKAVQQYEQSSSECFLTIYLNTETANGANAEWPLRLKNGLKKLMEYSLSGESPEQQKTLKRLCAKVEKDIDSHRTTLKKGLIVIASSSGDLYFLEKLQVQLPNAFYWESSPHLDEMNEVFTQYPAAGVIQVGSDHIRVLDTLLGNIHQEYRFDWDSQTENWREHIGAESVKKVSGRTQKENYDERIAVNKQRWMKRIIPVLQRFSKQKRWQELIFTGEKALAAELSKECDFAKTRVISKNMNGAPAHEVLNGVYSAIRA